MKTFRLMWDDFLIAWKAATPLARWLLVIFAILVGVWTAITILIAVTA